MPSYSYSFAAPLDPEACRFLEAETHVAFHHLDTSEWFCVAGRNSDGAVVGVLTLEPRNWFDWHWSCAIADPRVLSRRLLKTIFRTAFTRATRLSALIEPSNETALHSARRLGFLDEGYGRMMIEGSRDAVILGMLKHECPWLSNRSPRPTFLDIPHSAERDPIAFRKLAAGLGRGADRAHLSSSQASIAEGRLPRASNDLIGHVLPSGSPAEMAPIDTGATNTKRRMGSLFALGCWTVGALASQVVDPTHLRAAAAVMNHPITELVLRKGPDDAIVRLQDQSLFKKGQGGAVLGHTLSLNPKGERLHGF